VSRSRLLKSGRVALDSLFGGDAGATSKSRIPHRSDVERPQGVIARKDAAARSGSYIRPATVIIASDGTVVGRNAGMAIAAVAAAMRKTR
jgi:hypothetical protein